MSESRQAEAALHIYVQNIMKISYYSRWSRFHELEKGDTSKAQGSNEEVFRNNEIL